MCLAYVIIYHTEEEYAQYQIPISAVPAEIEESLPHYNGTILDYGDNSDEAKAAIEVIKFLALPEIAQYKIPKERALGTDCKVVAVYNIGAVL